MVAHPGAAGGPGRARQLNRPRPLRVGAGGDGRPVAVHLPIGRCAVEQVLEVWRIDDEWWRPQPVSRLYYRLALEGGRVVTVYRDLVRTAWFSQSY